MALETLDGVASIGGFKTFLNKTEGSGSEGALVEVAGETKVIPWAEFGDDFREEHPIGIHHGSNLLSFKIQNGPIKEVGVNGCQVDTVIETAKLIVENLNKNFPCRENALAITKLDEALMWLRERKRDRETRGVEGYNKA